MPRKCFLDAVTEQLFLETIIFFLLQEEILEPRKKSPHAKKKDSFGRKKKVTISRKHFSWHHETFL